MRSFRNGNRSRFGLRLASALLAGAALAAAVPVASQEAPEPPQDKRFAVNLFEPAPGPKNFFSVESPELGDDLKPFAGLQFSYQHRPFVIMSCSAGGDCEGENAIDIVQNLMVLDIQGSFNFLKRFQVGLDLPLVIWQRGENYALMSAMTPEGGLNQWLVQDAVQPTYSNFATIGDIRLHLKVRILGDESKDGFGLAAAIIPSLPMSSWTGQGDGYAGAASVAVTAPRVIAGYRFRSLRLALNLGALWQKKTEFFSAETGHALTYGGAVGFSVIPQIELMAEVYGRKVLSSSDFNDAEGAPLLFIGGGRFRAKQFLFNVGVGGGILSGVGVPQFQVMAGAAWAPEAEKKPAEETWFNPRDLDGDGIDNDADGCSDKPEDFDNFEDANGCPDEDNDKDLVPDGYDSCPMEAEDKDSFRDDDGCPDLDHDEDGIRQQNDKCPDNAEDFDGFEDEDGCPEADNDKDGVLDANEDCPDLAEDKDGFEDDDACPDLDNDADGVPDTEDKCPDEPETLNGVNDSDGCPDKGKTLVVVTDARIEIKEMVQFETDSDKIKGAMSFQILDIVAQVLKGNTAVRVSIEGHTDNRGDAKRNRELSKRRAEVVKKYLVDKGIAADRFETVGWGPDKPAVDNKTPANRKLNRRVEFVIIRPEKTAVSTDTTSTEKKPAAEDAPMDFTQGQGDESMDFTQGESGETMDFTVPEEPKKNEAPADQGGETMDFTTEEP